MQNPFLNEIMQCAAVGFAVAAVFVALVLAFDIGHLRALATTSEVGPMAIGMLFFFSCLTFSGAQCVFRNFSLFGDEYDE